jgi:hypothetical protein
MAIAGRGRPLTLTPETADKIVAALKMGNYRSAAAKYAGIEPATMRLWGSRANRGEQPFVDFIARVKAAEGEAEASLVATIRRAANDTWTAAAWLLERKHAPKWGKRDMSWENQKREKRAAQIAELAEIPIDELERMVTAEKARRARDAAATASDVGAIQ